MIEDLELNIKNIPLVEQKSREASLKKFVEKGFPNKRLEDWKFSDFNKIIHENFKKININKIIDEVNAIDLIRDFEHNHILLVNGKINSKNLKYEDEKNFQITEYKSGLIKKEEAQNSLINLNDALFEGGYFLEIFNEYKFKKPLIIYNYFYGDLKDKIINNKNLIILNKNTDIDLIELNQDVSKNNFIYNNYTSINISEKASLKTYSVQGTKSEGFFYKFIKVNLKENSTFEECIFSSGLKFNKVDENIDINGQNVDCKILSSLFLNSNTHQEIKTQINHLKPNCKSYQKIKKVLDEKSKGAYQGKIFVKDVAQKTDAYQLSKALLLSETSEFNAKPELEIYADDVKCSHGSTSGNMNEDSIFYLMTRGIPRKEAISLLTKAFLFENTNEIKNIEIKLFLEKNLERQINGY